MNKLELMYLSCPLLLNAQQEMSALIFWYEVQYVWVRISREGKITFLLLNGKLWPSKATPQHLSVGWSWKKFCRLKSNNWWFVLKFCSASIWEVITQKNSIQNYYYIYQKKIWEWNFVLFTYRCKAIHWSELIWLHSVTMFFYKEKMCWINYSNINDRSSKYVFWIL